MRVNRLPGNRRRRPGDRTRGARRCGVRPTDPPDNSQQARDVFEAAAAGDDSAQEIAAKLGEHFARAVRGLVMTLGIQRIVIGGGVAGGGEAFLQPIKQALADERRKSALVETAFAGTTLELLAPDLEPGARGAAAIARRRLAARQGEGVAAQ